MTPLLYDFWRSSAAYRVRLALGLKGIAFERVAVDLTTGQQRSAEHLAVNPQGLVPALRIDGHVLTQSLAIIDYLEATRPDPALLPPDPAARARMRAIALAIACDIHPLSNLQVLQRVEALAGPDARAAWNRDNIARGLGAVEALLDHEPPAPFAGGDRPGLVECVLLPQLYNADRWRVAWDHHPRITAIARNCTGIAALAAAHPDNFDPSREAGAIRGETA